MGVMDSNILFRDFNCRDDGDDDNDDVDEDEKGVIVDIGAFAVIL